MKNLYKKLNTLLTCLIGSFLGVFLGACLYAYWEHRAYPGLAALAAAPWYAGLGRLGGVTAGVIGVALLIKLLLRRKMG